MIQPRSLDMTLGNLTRLEGWPSRQSGRCLTIPDTRFQAENDPFFTSEYDANRVMKRFWKCGQSWMCTSSFQPKCTFLKFSTKPQPKRPPRADSFTVHTASEVYDFVKQLRQKYRARRALLF